MTARFPASLAVLPTDVVNAADGWPVAERAVGSAGVVVLEPVWQRLGALVVCAVAESVGPFAAHRLVEAFDLAVGAWPVGLGGEVPDLVAAEQFAQGAAVDVGEGVVGHHA